MSGIYIHIPFCKQACHYCDFHFSTSLKNIELLTEAMCKELKLQKDFFNGHKVNTIYFGGGTPSLLDNNSLNKITDTLYETFDLANIPEEFTFEANPDDINSEKLKTWKSIGVDRLSIGVQSFNKNILKFLNRAHDDMMAKKALEDCKSTGFNRFSLDLIYGIPGRDLNEWRKDIEKALSYDPEHISAYSLTIEEKTVFGNWLRKGKLEPMDDDEVIQQYLLLVKILEDHGYEHYEVSNFAKQGCRAVHNTSYWNSVPYLGIGPSAHSFLENKRWWNIANNQAYINSLNNGLIPYESETLSKENQINEYIMTKLRLKEGIDNKEFIKRFDYDFIEKNKSYLHEISSQELGVLLNNFFKLTTKGKLFADQIASNLFY
ncbi:radical SAM family heme chaperone HemW [Mangrovivirga sp. M17]|uniref:Heme chaperone HemW n=1 Tax=Mangrovivirga halotolerans TaxID=2993936 RepID=A0ABT3RWF4_9BACT|nr:radical SAM family heme chaperone HemW [Mangrovivirga halotolerans]MCX2745950.1 radical SAM family heme chaperone HemW [Mangrovivirga halotolerans]